METSRKSTVGVLELVRDSSAKWRLWDGEAIEIRSGEAEMNEKEVLRERRVKDSSRGWGMGVRKAICHFPLRGRGTRGASLRGFLQISAPFSSVSPVWPAEARWQLQLIAQQRLVWKEWDKRGEDKTEGG